LIVASERWSINHRNFKDISLDSNPMKVGYIFSGQGAQFVGMGQTLFNASAAARAIYEEANAVLGWDLAKLSFEGPDSELTQTKVCQPALYVHGCAALAALREAGKAPSAGAACGLSLGELTALHVAEVFDFATGLKLVAERGRLMQLACEASEGGMASVIGGTRDQVAELCSAHGIEIANLNCPGQIVISGEKARVIAAVESSKSYGFKLVKALNVAGAYHSRLMAPARDAFIEIVQSAPFNRPTIPVYTNVSGARVEEPDAIRQALVEQIVSPVHFEDCLRNAASENGIHTFFECGAGGVLAGLAKRTDRSLTVHSLSEFSDLEKIA
jgi:[acyl-carrier-protein] S-malonyltransferase